LCFVVAFPIHAGVELVRVFVQASRGELPVIARVPLERAGELASPAVDAGAAAVSLGAPRGALPLPAGGTARGRLYGPALFPLALSLVQTLSQAGVPVIGAGGVYTPLQTQAMLAAGALAVQLDAVLWRGGFLTSMVAAG
jgi:dihydroorotate dehydrogenase